MIRKTLVWGTAIFLAALLKPSSTQAQSFTLTEPGVLNIPSNECSSSDYCLNSFSQSSVTTSLLSNSKQPMIPWPKSKDASTIQGPLVLKNIPKPKPLPFLHSYIPVIRSPSDSSGGTLNPDILFAMINQHRSNRGLPTFEKNDELCSLAQSRGPELDSEIFVTHTMHSGLRSRNVPYRVTENMIHQSNEASAFGWWMNSGVHRRAIESDAKYSCGACVGNSCSQLFSSFAPKV